LVAIVRSNEIVTKKKDNYVGMFELPEDFRLPLLTGKNLGVIPSFQLPQSLKHCQGTSKLIAEPTILVRVADEECLRLRREVGW
jgi:hypothetical protein